MGSMGGMGLGMGGGAAGRERLAAEARRRAEQVNELASVRRPPTPNRPSRARRLLHRWRIRRLLRDRPTT